MGTASLIPCCNTQCSQQGTAACASPRQLPCTQLPPARHVVPSALSVAAGHWPVAELHAPAMRQLPACAAQSTAAHRSAACRTEWQRLFSALDSADLQVLLPFKIPNRTKSTQISIISRFALLQRCRCLTCAGAAQADALRACGAVFIVGGADTQADGGVACPSNAAAASLSSAVDVVCNTQVCSTRDRMSAIEYYA